MGKHEGEHLRRFIAARAKGDADAMRRWWEELVIDFVDRMDALVYLAHQGRLDAEEHEMAVQLSLVRFSERLIHTFEGVTMGELVNASKKLAWGICIDVQRASIRRREHEGRSLDAGWDADAEDRAMPTWEADEAADRFDREQRSGDVMDFLAWAMPQVTESRRAVLQLTFDGAELPEIADQLGITHDNAYQRRCRGMRDLTRLKEQYDR